MFDIHSHVMYAIDDGARSPEESLELIRADWEQGVQRLIATPHYSVSAPTNRNQIEAGLEELRKRLRSLRPDIADDFQIYSGNEVLYFDSMLEHLRDGRILTMAGTPAVLIEFYPRESYQKILRAVRKLYQGGYQPIIAHAERFCGLRANGLEEVIEAGAWIQISTEPFSHKGLSGLMDEELRFEKAALKKQQVHFLGSDMHRMDRRPPVLTQALRWVKQHLSEDYGDSILEGRLLDTL